jgi:hypothetical protein
LAVVYKAHSLLSSPPRTYRVDDDDDDDSDYEDEDDEEMDYDPEYDGPMEGTQACACPCLP